MNIRFCELKFSKGPYERSSKMLRKILMLRIILLIGNVCCLLFLIIYFMLLRVFPFHDSSYAYFMLFLFIIIIFFVLNVSFISKTGNKLKKLQSQVASLKKIKESKKMNVKEFLLIIGNIGLVLLFSFYLPIWRFRVNTLLTIISLVLIIVPLLNILFIKATSSVGASLSNDNTCFI